MTYAADDDAWPVCIDQMWGVATDDEVERYHQQRLARLAKRAPHVQIIDARKAAAMNPEQRQRLADFNAAHGDALGRWLAGVAFVGGSEAAKKILREVYGLEAPPYPTAAFDDRAEALEWAFARLRDKA
ncbi:MAG: hypothetical protein KC619_30480 [Myxococcales bacterium]|nr:hypothetical protein [Myxococcales bacterium]